MKIRSLTFQEIESFANRKDVCRDSVINFLMTVDNCGEYLNALSNLHSDAKLYGWNKQTVKAIYDGIKLSTN
jgi:hypothetical protein